MAFIIDTIKEPWVAIAQRIEFTRPLRVLVVEDNLVDRRMLESMLTESASYTSLVKSTDSLKSAVELLQEMDFEVVVLDLNLPDSKGEETIKMLAKKFPNLAIVVNTGAYEDDLGLQTLRIGAQDFLIKGKYSSYALNKVLHFALERKRLELELKEAYQKLKETQSQLIESEKMKVIGGLASGIAHEVKNPLATILYGVTYLIEQLKPKDEKVNLVLENIREATKRANDIINDMLDFSHITHLNKKMTDLNDVLEKALMLTNHHLEKGKIQLIKDFDRDIPSVKIDENRIEQVMVNLILNAIYAMPEGGILKIRTHSQRITKDLEKYPVYVADGFKPDQTIVLFEVEDTGCGIPQDKLEKVFDPFFTTRRASGGIGLGLTVSRNIMEIHEGKIFIENNDQQGARATLVFKA